MFKIYSRKNGEWLADREDLEEAAVYASKVDGEVFKEKYGAVSPVDQTLLAPLVLRAAQRERKRKRRALIRGVASGCE